MTRSCSRVKSSGADIIGSYFTFPNDQAIFARQLRQLGVTPLSRIAHDRGRPTVEIRRPHALGAIASPIMRRVELEAKEFANLYSAVERSARQLQFVDL